MAPTPQSMTDLKKRRSAQGEMHVWGFSPIFSQLDIGIMLDISYLKIAQKYWKQLGSWAFFLQGMFSNEMCILHLSIQVESYY